MSTMLIEYVRPTERILLRRVSSGNDAAIRRAKITCSVHIIHIDGHYSLLVGRILSAALLIARDAYAMDRMGISCRRRAGLTAELAAAS